MIKIKKHDYFIYVDEEFQLQIGRAKKFESDLIRLTKGGVDVKANTAVFASKNKSKVTDAIETYGLLNGLDDLKYEKKPQKQIAIEVRKRILS